MKTNDVGKDQLREDQMIKRAAVLVAEGKKTDKEIARELNVSSGVLGVWRKSPLFGQLVATYGDQIQDRTVDSIVGSIMEDTPKNLNFLRSVRDGTFDETKERMDARLRAAKMLWDKQVPNAGDNATEGALKVVIGGRMLEQMIRAMKNDGVIDITPEQEKEALRGFVPVLTTEDFAAKYEAEQDAAAKLEEEDE